MRKDLSSIKIISKPYSFYFACGNRENPGSSQMSTLVYFVLGQTERRRKPYFERGKHKFILYIILHRRVMLTPITVFLILFLSGLWDQGTH